MSGKTVSEEGLMNMLIYVGIGVAGASLVVGIVVIAVLWISKRRLNSKLDSEYGEKQ